MTYRSSFFPRSVQEQSADNLQVCCLTLKLLTKMQKKGKEEADYRLQFPCQSLNLGINTIPLDPRKYFVIRESS